MHEHVGFVGGLPQLSHIQNECQVLCAWCVHEESGYLQVGQHLCYHIVM